jgi:DNA-directed RNA polymerase specialized sigma24 family protein
MVWRALVGDAWFQTELFEAAKRLACSTRRKLYSADDVWHEALLLLWTRVCRAPDLNLDRVPLESAFPGWIAAVARNLCRNALRKHRR